MWINMSEKSKISIITACYNAEKTIEQTIQSVINQSYNNIEYIIVDGASTDGTMDIVRKYEKQIDIIISEPDKGIYDAFNKGAKNATGEYVQYLNADDYLMSSDVLDEVSSFLYKNRNAVLVYGGILIENEDTGYKLLRNKKFTFKDIQEGRMIPHPATFLRRDILLEMGLFDTQYCIASDYDLICKVYMKYNDSILYYPKLIATFRTGGMSSDFKNKEKVSAETQAIINKYFGDNKYEIPKIDNEAFLKKWIEKELFEDKSIGDLLVKRKINNVALWGTGELSVILFKELKSKGIDILYYIDNDKEKQNLVMNSVPIMYPEYLKEHYKDIDCIIMSFEGRHEESVLRQIDSYYLPSELLIYSWRDLIKEL
ncbi:glycosyltransferase [Lysinibacillus pakistanensis]|uniref:glycosyltransferase n=1 Tax=Lysinibacillus pakistanensis TaxID=759811 RepID=UPI003D28B9FD